MHVQLPAGSRGCSISSAGHEQQTACTLRCMLFSCACCTDCFVFIADNDQPDVQTNGKSDHQQPSRAPEPPPRQHSETELPFPEPPAAAKPTDATATIELAVKLRSLVLSISTDSVCVGIRMMERFQQYAQHAHLWQGRPQVSMCTTMAAHSQCHNASSLLFGQICNLLSIHGHT